MMIRNSVYELRVAGCGLRVAGYGLRVAHCESRGVGCDVRGASHKERVTDFSRLTVIKKSTAA